MQTGFAKWATRRRCLGLGACCGVVLLLAYPLAAGPAVRLMQRRAVNQELVVAIFLDPECPLQIAMGVIPGGDACLRWWVGLWELKDLSP